MPTVAQRKNRRQSLKRVMTVPTRHILPRSTTIGSPETTLSTNSDKFSLMFNVKREYLCSYAEAILQS